MSKQVKLKIDKEMFENLDRVLITSLDPGKITGVAVCVLDRVDAKHWYPAIETLSLGWPGQAEEIADIIQDRHVVIAEDFRVREQEALSLVGDVLWSAKVLGWVEGTLQTTKLPKPILVYQAAWAKNFCALAVAKKRLGWLPTSDHERDALMHLLFFLAAK